MKHYPLKIENVGDDVYCLMSRGHHDIHIFMHRVREDGYTWTLGTPEHLWFHPVPNKQTGGSYYAHANPGSRGSFPATCVTESCLEESYEVKCSII